MIDKHYNLSCYALQHPYQAYYSQHKNMIELIDINNEIYQFRLPDYEHYDVRMECFQKVIANCKVNRYYRIYGTTILLYQTHQLYITNNQEQPHLIENIEDVSLFSTPKQIHLLLNPVHKLGNGLFIQKVSFLLDQTNSNHKVQISRLRLESSFSQLHFTGLNEQSHHSKISKIFGQYCLLENDLGMCELAKLHFEPFFLEPSNQRMKYQILHHFQFPKMNVVGTFKHTFIYLSQQEEDHSGNSPLYFCDPTEEHQVIKLKDYHSKQKKIDYFIYEKYLIFIEGIDLMIFQIVTGTLMAKINIITLVQQFEKGSAMILGVQHQKQPRYSILFDQIIDKAAHFYLMDKQKITIYHINIRELLESSFLTTIKDKMKLLHSDNQEIHQNVLKTVNFRLKKLETLQQYVNEGLKTFSFGNVYRFLHNQNNIFVMSDGLFLFYNSVSQNQERIIKEKSIVLEIQKENLLIVFKLVNESKYENHILRGLIIANEMFNEYRNKHKILQKKDNLQFYNQLLESKRVIKLLKQDKNKKLFQLCYQLSIGVKGYDYLQQIEKGKK